MSISRFRRESFRKVVNKALIFLVLPETRAIIAVIAASYCPSVSVPWSHCYRWRLVRRSDTIIPSTSRYLPCHLTEEDREPDVYYEKPSTPHDSFHFLPIECDMSFQVTIWHLNTYYVSTEIRRPHSSSATKKATFPSWLLPENHSAETECNSQFLAVTCSLLETLTKSSQFIEEKKKTCDKRKHA